MALKDEGLQVVLERTDEPDERESLRLNLELLGGDHPGIVAEISASLAARDVSIEELSTDVRDAPMAGGTIFEARAVLSAPPTTSTEELRSMLEGLAERADGGDHAVDRLSTGDMRDFRAKSPRD